MHVTKSSRLFCLNSAITKLFLLHGPFILSPKFMNVRADKQTNFPLFLAVIGLENRYVEDVFFLVTHLLFYKTFILDVSVGAL